MKKQLFLYAVLVLGFILYNAFFRSEDQRMDTLINILYTSLLFLYMGYMAFIVLRRMKQRKQS
ncbi:hypothetical protein [Bergeyella sp. RCAD1439]|uniref:hypothetical protein n=1 Tax=Bergeyella anatis TaxID=3113737 RepID=UPI002E187908|nr:hypothetical protein [Bergeyella sp. RCAD1439]